MLWAVFAALTAVFESIKDVLGKRGVQRDDAILVAWGGLFFGESGIRERLPGAVVMLAGVLCITLWG